MSFLTVADNAIFYEQAGAGPDVVLLHHAIGSTQSWRKVVPTLAERCHVTVYDRPGFGQSAWRAAWTLDYLDQDVAELIALLDTLHIAQAALVGHSDGATIALLAAARFPTRVTRVLVESPHVAVETPRCPAAIATFAAEVVASAVLQAALTRNHGARALDVVQRWQSRWCDPAFWVWNVAAELAAVPCPVQVVHGADDPYFSVDHSAMIARSTRGALHVLPCVGHSPHSEAFDQFLPLLAFI